MLGTELFQLQLNLRMRLKCVYETDRHGVFLTFCVKKHSFWFYQFKTGLAINFVTDFVIIDIYINQQNVKKKAYFNQTIQNSCQLIILREKKNKKKKKHKKDHITPLFQSLHWLPIQQQIQYKINTGDVYVK